MISVDKQTELLVLRWTSFCSDKNHIIQECKKYTDDILENSENKSITLSYMANYINSIFINRGFDTEFLNFMFDYKNQKIDIEIVNSFFQSTDSKLIVKVNDYIEKYENIHGEDNDILSFKLKYYILPINYSKYKEEIPRIISLLG